MIGTEARGAYDVTELAADFDAVITSTVSLLAASCRTRVPADVLGFAPESDIVSRARLVRTIDDHRCTSRLVRAGAWASFSSPCPSR
ncbi:hypothetical protein [Amycolatopsis alba]|uniref:Uncharacterized protein n=1 Tax=Amycolatopsis alba DSM 44262 TaxID=1125972 RepID=A0A229RL26_AMYAL|nr:hypothetical protein [Amycolatopsis alba]OXM47378.1 hypothetical protein CFP75_24375 [Amycolatopsis alba DSM 44262]